MWKFATGKIVAVGPLTQVPAHEEVQALGDQMLIPSFIDCHVHFFLSALIDAGKLKPLTGAN